MVMKPGPLLVAGLGATFVLTSCGGSAGDEEQARSGAMYTWLSNQSDREQWEAFIEAAQQENPDFELSLEGPSFEDYWTTVRTRMGASDAPCILTTQAARAQELEEVLLPLDDLVEQSDFDVSAYNEAMIEGMTLDGSLRAIPYDAQPVLLYFNKDIFDEAGVEHPGLGYTRDQYLQDLQQIAETGAQGVAVGPAIDNTPGLFMAFADGSAPVVDGEYRLTDPDFVDSVQWGFDLVAEHGLGSAPSSGDPTDIGMQTFMGGDVATLMEGPWFYESIVEETDAEIGVAVVPSEDGTTRGMIQGSGFGISQSCDDPEAAFENIMAITTPSVIAEVGSASGNVPSMQEATDDWAETRPADVVEAVENMLEDGLALETTANWNQVAVSFSQSSGEGYRGTRTAEEILSDIEDSVQ